MELLPKLENMLYSTWFLWVISAEKAVSSKAVAMLIADGNIYAKDLS